MPAIEEDDWASWLGGPDESEETPVTQEAPVIAPVEYVFDHLDIPDIAPAYQDDGLRDFVAALDIVDMYRRYCGKMEPNIGNKRESVMISCPIPGHRDNDPSAWMNLDKNTWFCGGCQKGGDGLDIFLMNHKGLQHGERRMGSTFQEAITEIAKDHGFDPAAARSAIHMEAEPDVHPQPAPESEPPSPGPDVGVKVPGMVPTNIFASGQEFSVFGQQTLTGPPQPTVTVVNEPEPDPITVQVIEGQGLIEPALDDDGEHYIPGDPFPWRDIYADEGFRHAYMQETAISRILPHEFHACMADQLVGMVAGHNVIKDESDPVYANLYSCMLGPTGVGKSRTLRPALQLLRDEHPYNSLTGEGTKILDKPGSGEQLITAMERKGLLPIGVEGYLPVEGFLNIDELSDIVARSARKGSTLQPTLIEMYSAASSTMTTSALSSGKHVAECPYLGVVAGTQPDVLPKLLTDDDLASGFLNRFAFYVATRPETPPGYDTAKGDPPYTLSESRNRFMDLKAWTNVERRIDFAPGADAVYVDALRSEDLMGYAWRGIPILARLELLFKKLILLNCVDVMAPAITGDNIERAKMQIQYFIKSYGFTRKSMESGEHDKCMDRILKLTAVPTGVTEGILRNKFRAPKYIDIFDKVLRHAVDTGAVIAVQTAAGRGKVGRPSVRYTERNQFVADQSGAVAT